MSTERKYILPKAYIDQVATLTCDLCDSRVTLTRVKDDYENNYPWRTYIGSIMCGRCAHDLFNEHQDVPQGKNSNVCRCGQVISAK